MSIGEEREDLLNFRSLTDRHLQDIFDEIVLQASNHDIAGGRILFTGKHKNEDTRCLRLVRYRWAVCQSNPMVSSFHGILFSSG